MILMRPTMTFGWLLTAILAMAIVLSPVSGVVRSDEPVAPSLEQQPLFEAGKDGYVKYRIPSLVVTSRGTVLALCEARKQSGHDWDDVDLALRRSTDHGRTWSKMQIIAEQGELTINQPCPVIDHQTGTIWLPLCRGSKPGLGNAEVLLMKSTDDGQTWSRPVSIHQSVADPSWTFIGTGPGHGIQLKSGRLLIPCWFDLTPTCGEIQSSCCIYSDDHGETWKRGEPLTKNACDECDIVELEDGTVYLNARSHSQKQRAYAFSKDGGQSWSAVQYDPNQPEPCCDGALIRLSDSRHLDRNRVLVACPTNPDTRVHIRVRMSYDECQTWPIASEPLAHFGGYSDLAVTGDRQILCLYEDFGDNRFNLVLAKFNVEWLSDGQFDDFGMFARPQTPYDFKLRLDLEARRMTVWVCGRGDDDWFLLAEHVPLEHPLETIDSIRVQKNAGAPGVHVTVQSTLAPEAEQVRPHPQPIENPHVMDGSGFTRQSMRSTWRQPRKQVTIARNNTDDTAPACLATPNWPTGLPWIRGTWRQPADLQMTNVKRVLTP